MNIQLPDPFVERMRQQLGDELTAFLHALEQPSLRGIRLNPLKKCDAQDSFRKADPIPWADDAWYLSNESKAGASVLHEAGAFYIQEPGAMIPAAVLDAKPGEKILDLCAAPGGKSTQIGCAMRGEGLLVCNEPVPKRAQILSRNIERMGLPNTIVTCAWPDRLAEQWPEGFDAVMADVPCSGEGMFRREPETRNEWSAEKADGCVLRQREILAAAARLVKPGGRMVYSTCTYHPAENEGNAHWFTEHFPEFRTEAFCLPGIDAPEGMYTCYPHRVKGEGQFAALFRKAGNSPAFLPPDQSLPKAACEAIRAFEEAFKGFPRATHLFGKTIISIEELPELKGIRTLRIGLHLGEIRGKTVVPDHATALYFSAPDMQAVEMRPEEAVQFAAGEAIPGDAAGWTLMRYRGLNTGWGKGSEGIIRNHYPKGLRGVHFNP